MEQEGIELNKAREAVSGSETHDREETIAYFIVGIFIAVLIAVLFSIFFLKQKEAKLTSLDEEINQSVTQPLQSYGGTLIKVVTILAQLDALNAALNSRIKYSSILTDLANLEFKKSRWTSVALQKDDTMVISGSADSFEDVAKAVIALRSLKAATDTKLSSANVNAESGKIDFVVNLKINKTMYRNLVVKQTTTGIGTSAGVSVTATPLSGSAGSQTNSTPIVASTPTAIIGSSLTATTP